MRLQQIAVAAITTSVVVADFHPPNPRFLLQLETNHGHHGFGWDGKFIAAYPMADAPLMTLHVVDQGPFSGYFEQNNSVVAYQSKEHRVPQALSLHRSSRQGFRELIVSPDTPYDEGFSFDHQDYLQYHGNDGWFVCERHNNLGLGQIYFARKDSNFAQNCESINIIRKFLLFDNGDHGGPPHHGGDDDDWHHYPDDDWHHHPDDDDNWHYGPPPDGHVGPSPSHGGPPNSQHEAGNPEEKYPPYPPPPYPYPDSPYGPRPPPRYPHPPYPQPYPHHPPPERELPAQE